VPKSSFVPTVAPAASSQLVAPNATTGFEPTEPTEGWLAAAVWATAMAEVDRSAHALTFPPADVSPLEGSSQSTRPATLVGEKGGGASVAASVVAASGGGVDVSGTAASVAVAVGEVVVVVPVGVVPASPLAAGSSPTQPTTMPAAANGTRTRLTSVRFMKTLPGVRLTVCEPRSRLDSREHVWRESSE
jgi:hypothetical protein